MKIELKRDDPTLKDITIEMKSGYYINQDQWGYGTEITVQQLVEFYEKWIEIAISTSGFASLKESAKKLLKTIEELATYHDDDPDEYPGRDEK